MGWREALAEGNTGRVGKLAPDLLGPVGLELARAVEQLPGQHGMPGGSRYELKWDGFRVGVVCREGDVRLWSRNGKDFTAKFPDVQAALEAQLSADCVLDGELVVWTGERLDFDALQQRIHPAESRVQMLSRQTPTSYIAFDLLAQDGEDLRKLPLGERRSRLEALLAACAPAPSPAGPASAGTETCAIGDQRLELRRARAAAGADRQRRECDEERRGAAARRCPGHGSRV